MAPAHEGLGAGETAGVGVDDCLIEDFEFVRLEATAEAGSHLEPLDGLDVHVGPVHLEAALAVALGKVHRKIGVPKQIVGALLRPLTEGDADAGPHRDVVVLNTEGRSEGFGDPLGDHLCCIGHRARLDQHRELVATEPCDGVTGPRRSFRAVRRWQPIGGRRQGVRDCR